MLAKKGILEVQRTLDVGFLGLGFLVPKGALRLFPTGLKKATGLGIPRREIVAHVARRIMSHPVEAQQILSRLLFRRNRH